MNTTFLMLVAIIALVLICAYLGALLHYHVKTARETGERLALRKHRDALYAELTAAIPSSDSLAVRDVGKLRSLLYTLIFSSRP